MISLGLERLLQDPPPSLQGKRLGLLCNQASTDRRLRHARDLVHGRFGPRLCCLFSPQHGFFAEKQDNMIESGHMTDPVTGLPLFSLYGEVRKPTPAMLEHCDVLLVDLVDVGTRVYTFLYTLAYCMEAAAEQGKQVVVLDRPNPVGGLALEGNLLQPSCRSFVGLYPIPMRHGLTMGELALMLKGEYGLDCDLEVIPMAGWRREMLFADTGLPWVFPSPNMPTPQTALVYPGQVIWEGTNISEGRGTTLPFELFGAPFWRHDEMLAELAATPLPGCYLRPLVFEPVAGKWAGKPCVGYQLHVTDPVSFLPFRTTLALLQATARRHQEFALKSPPYEYEYEKTPIHLILGDEGLWPRLQAGEPLLELEAGWQVELDDFARRRQDYLLY
ncbi:exo-beta-N-acetylmuramidase NamZ family protein [Desulfurivibrio dismutans]|uniref:exo-beta-N-acetylmuramidase NamZ family protein n=1 Tax=Desulfurivibrio dismutans TaxID=1398908 RepID=UPI003D6487FD